MTRRFGNSAVHEELEVSEATFFEQRHLSTVRQADQRGWKDVQLSLRLESRLPKTQHANKQPSCSIMIRFQIGLEQIGRSRISNISGNS